MRRRDDPERRRQYARELTRRIRAGSPDVILLALEIGSGANAVGVTQEDLEAALDQPL